ncbi:hypothetical protein AX16_006109 [Volvariella volvacea WC 439]|nr:hypothetical protein AX16_006109 [Volvariella volvacea WC 439]
MQQMGSQGEELSRPIGIIGAGAAGLITAHTLIKDGFTNVQILTRDASVGGVWARDRIYPGLFINNVHGEFRFSELEMAAPAQGELTGGRLSGYDMCAYMELFAEKFLQGRIQFNTEILNIRRENPDGSLGWTVSVLRKESRVREHLNFARIVLCTGGCSAPLVPRYLSPGMAQTIGFQGLVIHSSEFRAKLDEITDLVRPIGSGRGPDGYAGTVVIVGGGKSAQDIAAHLANEGRKVTMVFQKTDAFLAGPSPLPPFIRKSRFLSVLSPHIELKSKLEQFLHTTWLGGKITHAIWNQIASTSFAAAHLPKNSPLRNTNSLFWEVRTNDEGVPRPKGFFNLVNTGKIEIIAPARVQGYGDDGESLVLSDNRTIRANVVILATGFESSWKDIFDVPTAASLGISRHPPSSKNQYTWNYTSLENPPKPPAGPHLGNGRTESAPWLAAIHRGIVPAKNIMKRDFSINGGVFTTNNGYTFEVTAHWIASYFRGDNIRLPGSVPEAIELAERNSAWLRTRYPTSLGWVNESYSSSIVFWTWPQYVDDLLEDMRLPTYRSGGTWWDWVFKIIDLNEIKNLTEERRALRESESENGSGNGVGSSGWDKRSTDRLLN